MTSATAGTAPAGTRPAPADGQEAPGTAAPADAVPAAPARRAGRHVHEVDVVRVLTFVAVVGVHATGGTTDAASHAGNAALNLLHFTREAFFVLTGFVLVHSYADRPPRGAGLRRFWSRRLLLVGVPYTVWTAVYGAAAVYDRAGRDGFVGGLRGFTGLLVSGDAHYHLYFLLVSLQVYVVTPVLLAVVRRAAGRLGVLLAAGCVFQAAVLVALQYGPPQGGVLGWLQHYAHVLLPTYLYWVLLGAVAAARVDALRDWVDGHPRVIAVAVLAGAAVAELCYAALVHRGHTPAFAASVFQPVMIVWGTSIVLGLFALGRVWAARRTAHPVLDRVLRAGSELSFGVYLIHPLFVDTLVTVMRGAVPAPLSTILVVAAALVGSAVLVGCARATVLSLPISGRPMRRAPAAVSGHGGAVPAA